MSIVTKTGDRGETGLGDGTRVPKSDVRLHAVGTVDELNTVLGVILSDMALAASLRENLQRLQHLLFRLGADLSMPERKGMTAKRIEESHVKKLEGWIATLELTLPSLRNFILPGGQSPAAQLHVARTVCRRAERWAVALAEFEPVNSQATIFLNRLSDYLFLAAREQNRVAGAAEVTAEF